MTSVINVTSRTSSELGRDLRPYPTEPQRKTHCNLNHRRVIFSIFTETHAPVKISETIICQAQAAQISDKVV